MLKKRRSIAHIKAASTATTTTTTTPLLTNGDGTVHKRIKSVAKAN